LNVEKSMAKNFIFFTPIFTRKRAAALPQGFTPKIGVKKMKFLAILFSTFKIFFHLSLNIAKKKK